jgi:hypothetical protein
MELLATNGSTQLWRMDDTLIVKHDTGIVSFAQDAHKAAIDHFLTVE